MLEIRAPKRTRNKSLETSARRQAGPHGALTQMSLYVTDLLYIAVYSPPNSAIHNALPPSRHSQTTDPGSSAPADQGYVQGPPGRMGRAISVCTASEG